MITIELQKHHCYEVFDSGMSIGCISFHRNPYHAQNYYLDFDFIRYDSSIAKELFTLLWSELSRPLQVMLSSCDLEKCAFLTSGGFQRKRQCYEMEVSAKDLCIPVKKSVPMVEATRGTPSYLDCCELLYHCYAKTHEAISPLTADRELFYSDLPDKVIFYQENSTILHFAFIEENEIAYIGTTRQSDFHRFAQTLLAQMFAQYSSISFECDDCDSVAMELKSFFDTPGSGTYDTYILDSLF